MLSPLYSAEKYNGELTGNDRMLVDIQTFIKDNTYDPYEYYDILSTLNSKHISYENISNILSPGQR